MSGNEAFFTALKSGELWVQPGGPGTVMYMLGCHELGDIDNPDGDVTKVYCIRNGAYEVVGETQSPPGNVAFQLSTFLPKARAWIEKMKCPGAFYIIQRSCGRAGNAMVYDRLFVATNARRVGRSYGGLVRRSEDAPGMLQANFVADAPLLDVVALKAVRLSSAETEDLTDISLCNEATCAGSCGAAEEAGQDGFVVGEAKAGSPANTADVLFTVNGGGAWSFGATDPFAGGYDIAFGKCFGVGRAGVRRLVGRGTTVVASPSQVKYSDDDGATWSALVDVGDTNGQFFDSHNACFALDLHNIWACTTGGFIYHSTDGGATWTEQEAGSITAQDWQAIHFADENYGLVGGALNTLAVTSDGGDTWAALTGPAARAADTVTAVQVINSYTYWIAYGTGYMYRSIDSGATWTMVAGWTGAGAGSISDLKFISEYIGWMIHNSAAPVGTLFRTFNGGADWEALVTPANAGLNALSVIDENTAFAVGNVSGGTAVIIKVTES